MNHNLKVKQTHLLCGFVLLLSLISGQTQKLFGISSGFIYQLLYFSKYFATAFLFVYAISKRRKISKAQIGQFIMIFVPLIVLMLIDESIAIFTSPIVKTYGFKYWSRSLYILLDRICIYVAVVSIWMLCEDEAVDCLASVLLMDELIIFLSGFINVGISGITQSVIVAFTFKGFTSNYFEIHEQTYAVGLCIIYYLFFDKEKKNKTAKIILLIICFILGTKRIGFLGVVVAGLFALFIHKKGLTRRKLILTGLAGVFISFFYLFIIYNNELFAFLSGQNINNTGRDLIYAYFTKRTEFSPSQVGWGIAGVAKAIENMDRSEVMYMSVIRGMHNDILRIYVDFGFLGSLLWYSFNLIYVPVKLLGKYGKRSATVYMAMILYVFIIYLTDNIQSSYICQISLYLFPLVVYLKEKENRKQVSSVGYYHNEIQRNNKKVIIPE